MRLCKSELGALKTPGSCDSVTYALLYTFVRFENRMEIFMDPTMYSCSYSNTPTICHPQLCWQCVIHVERQRLTYICYLSSILQHVSVTIMQIAALTMKLKDLEFAMIANTTQSGITVSFAKCPFTEMQLFLKMTQTLVLVSSLSQYNNIITICKCDASYHGWCTGSTVCSVEKELYGLLSNQKIWIRSSVLNKGIENDITN